MLVAVRRELVPAPGDLVDEVGPATCALTQDEERGPRSDLVERVEHPGRPFRVGPVVERQCDLRGEPWALPAAQLAWEHPDRSPLAEGDDRRDELRRERRRGERARRGAGSCAPALAWEAASVASDQGTDTTCRCRRERG